MNNIEYLLKEAASINYPKNWMCKINGQIKEISFFPGGKGTIDGIGNIEERKIMVLGQDWGTYEGFKVDVKNGTENITKNPTWRNILKLLHEKELDLIPEQQCFFTNAILGARTSGSVSGQSPAFKKECTGFLNTCKEFFKLQLKTQKPEIVLVLGMQTARFLASISNDFSKWTELGSIKKIDEADKALIRNARIGDVVSNYVLLIHPSYKPVNRKKSNNRGAGIENKDHEITLIKKALKN